MGDRVGVGGGRGEGKEGGQKCEDTMVLICTTPKNFPIVTSKPILNLQGLPNHHGGTVPPVMGDVKQSNEWGQAESTAYLWEGTNLANRHICKICICK